MSIPDRIEDAEHVHRFNLQLGPDGHGLVFGNYEGYVHRCRCGEYRDDYKAYLATFHECPDCGARHRIARQELSPVLPSGRLRGWRQEP